MQKASQSAAPERIFLEEKGKWCGYIYAHNFTVLWPEIQADSLNTNDYKEMF